MTMPDLCDHHGLVIDRMAALSHIDNDVTEEAARAIARQCTQCPKGDQ